MYIERILKEIESDFPALIKTTQLIKVGIFSSHSQASLSRKNGQGPECLYLSSKRILYPKQDVINWLLEKVKLSQKKAASGSANV